MKHPTQKSVLESDQLGGRVFMRDGEVFCGVVVEYADE